MVRMARVGFSMQIAKNFIFFLDKSYYRDTLPM